jgi:hypothetical protein
MQPSAGTDLSRTFRAGADGVLRISGDLQKDPSAEQNAPVYVRILQNERQIWPEANWQIVPAFGSGPMRYDLKTAARKGDSIRFIVKRNGENRAQPIIWNPVVVVSER